MDSQRLRFILTGQYAPGGRGELCPVRRVPLYNCWGLVMALTALFGCPVPEYDEPATPRGVHRAFDQRATLPGWNRLDGPVPGCVIGLRTHPRYTELVCHFGVVLDACRFAHIQRDAGLHVSRFDQPPYRNMLAGFYAWNA